MIKFVASVEKSNGSVFNCRTTSMDELMNFLVEYEKDYQRVNNDDTGELLYSANHPIEKDYMDEQFQLMCLGWVLSEPEPVPDTHVEPMKSVLEVCQELGILI